MSTDRLTRVNALLKQEIATALFRVMGQEGVDLAAVTVTRVFTSSDLHSARVLVSIRDHRDERGRMLRALARRRGEIQDIIRRNVVLKYTPRLTFELDESIEQGDHILQVLSDMERRGEVPPPEPEPPPAPAGGEDDAVR